MATMKSDEEMARLVLEICAHRKARSGTVLMWNHITAAQAQNLQLTGEDWVRGIAYAREKGWIELVGGNLKLTELGFSEMPSFSD